MAKPKQKNEVAVQKGGAVAVGEVPDFMKKYAGQGTENLGAEDVEIPRIVLLQSLSEQVQDGDEKAGSFWHSIAEETLGDTLKIVPVYVDIRYILWKPRHEGGGILARADDGKNWVPANAEFTVKPYKDSNKSVVWKTKPTVQESGLANWGSSDPDSADSQPAATKMYNIVAVLPDHPELSPCLITLQRGAVGVAKKLMGKIRIAGAPSWGQVYEMTVVKADSGSGAFYAPQFEKIGIVQDEAEAMSYKAMHDAFDKAGLKVKDIEALQEDGDDDVDESKSSIKM